MDGIQVERTVRQLVFYLNYREPQAVHFCFFLGIGRICRNEKAGAPIETPAHSCRFAQSYSSWSCSPAEPHYASYCGTKVHTRFGLAIKITEKIILQFELLNTYYSKKSCKMSYTPKKRFHNEVTIEVIAPLQEHFFFLYERRLRLFIVLSVGKNY